MGSLSTPSPRSCHDDGDSPRFRVVACGAARGATDSLARDLAGSTALGNGVGRCFPWLVGGVTGLVTSYIREAVTEQDTRALSAWRSDHSNLTMPFSGIR